MWSSVESWDLLRPCLRNAYKEQSLLEISWPLFSTAYSQCHALQKTKKTHTMVCLLRKDHKTKRQINRHHTNVLSRLFQKCFLPNVVIFVILSLKWSNATQTIVFSADYFHFSSTVRAAGETHLCLAAGWQGQHGGLGHRQAALVVVNTMGHMCSLCRWSAPRTVTHSSREEATVWKCGNVWDRVNEKRYIKKTKQQRHGSPPLMSQWRGEKNTHVHVNTVLHYTKLRCLHWAVELTNSNTPSVIVNHQYLAYFLHVHTADQSWHPSRSSNNPTEVGILVDILFIYYSHH